MQQHSPNTVGVLMRSVADILQGASPKIPISTRRGIAVCGGLVSSSTVRCSNTCHTEAERCFASQSRSYMLRKITIEGMSLPTALAATPNCWALPELLPDENPDCASLAVAWVTSSIARLWEVSLESSSASVIVSV